MVELIPQSLYNNCVIKVNGMMEELICKKCGKPATTLTWKGWLCDTCFSEFKEQEEQERKRKEEELRKLLARIPIVKPPKKGNELKFISFLAHQFHSEENQKALKLAMELKIPLNTITLIRIEKEHLGRHFFKLTVFQGEQKLAVGFFNPDKHGNPSVSKNALFKALKIGLIKMQK